MSLPLLRPPWPSLLGSLGVHGAMSQRGGGVSTGAWSSLNLGATVGDSAAAVAENRARFSAALGAQPVWLRQAHGIKVLRLQDGAARDEVADAAWTSARGVACTVLVADCLPVLFAAADGRAVAAAHAGWRGLAAGVLEATMDALQEGAGVPPAGLHVWLGPCIGPRHFEVGEDVLLAFGQSATAHDPQAFVARKRPDGSPRWLADLQYLAELQLQATGVGTVSRAAVCTVETGSRFFSFRRDGVCGRMAAAVWLA